MADRYFHLSAADRLNALEAAATGSGRPAALLEKDVWVVWAIDVLFRSDYGQSLVFKGGTSLSKAHGIIHRFSEDVDVTYDIRRLAPDLTSDGKVLPATRSQAQKWTKRIRADLATWVAESVAPLYVDASEHDKLGIRCDIAGDTIRLVYRPVIPIGSYVQAAVLLEFGGRSTGEPCDVVPISCDASEWLADVDFPTATPRVMRPERTFWEKATAVDVFCRKGRFGGTDRFSRHWHDLARLDDAGVVELALADRDLALDVANHKSIFFAEKDADGTWIDYASVVSGDLRLVPEPGPLRDDLGADYGRMGTAGLLDNDTETFEELLARCEEIERRANS